ncbi:hypothetical protein THAOC_10365 [Thalassiosira oceanica]|uniref:DUF6820 domain-containing protein n=1 Tax=Thalassiosira oceanica TaxID=159749 RepID=K0STZ3_THAOC|nr:hypothetical protein THAOC_10365 [Thalassiosira oceanica]|eukprot:EJK68449.1 hypothetical protein THAOC_10365 [Thalassiosira oceanica]
MITLSRPSARQPPCAGPTGATGRTNHHEHKRKRAEKVPPPTDRGAAEEPLRSLAQISGRKEVQMVSDGHAALQGLSSIPYLTSVAAGFYRNDFIYGSETSAGRARSMMSEFAVAPACLIDNGGRRAIGIALQRPRHFIGDVLGMNRCHDAMGAVIGPPGEAMEELDSPYHHCCAVVPAELTGCSVTINYSL